MTGSRQTDGFGSLLWVLTAERYSRSSSASTRSAGVSILARPAGRALHGMNTPSTAVGMFQSSLGPQAERYLRL